MAQKAEVVFEPVSAGSRVLASTQAGSVTHSLRRTKASLIYRRTGNCARSNFCSAIAKLRAPQVSWH